MKNKTENENGFTLIELLVVILIIGILAAIAVPVFLNQRQKANETAVISDLKNAGMLLEGQSKFTGELPEDTATSTGVTLSAMRTADRNNQIVSSQFTEGNASRWNTFIGPPYTATRTDKLFTDASDGYQGMNYRRVTVNSTVPSINIGQNVSIDLTKTGQKGDVYTVGIAMRHNYDGCRTLHIEFKNRASGAWPGGITQKQVCFAKDTWEYYELTGTMTGSGADMIFISAYGVMVQGQSFDATGAVIVKSGTINAKEALSTQGNDFCIEGYHENNESNIWRYSSLDGGVSKGSC